MNIKDVGLGFWIFLAFLIAGLGFFFFQVEELTQNYIQEHGYTAIYTISLISDLLVQPIGPDVPLAIGVTILNPITVLIVVLLGSYTTMLIAYLIGLKLGKPALKKLLGKKQYDKMHNNLHYGKIYIIVSSFSPIPYVPYLAGMWKLKFWEVLLYQALPRTIRFIIVFAVVQSIIPL